jgi:hypothetical protein
MRLPTYPMLYGQTPRELRWMTLRWFVAPFARAVFHRVPAAQSIVFAVAQYWNDEASDAAHHVLVPTDQRDPSWPECLSYEHNKLVPVELPYNFAALNEEEQQWAREEAIAQANDGANYSRYAIENGEHGTAFTFVDALFGAGSFLDDNDTFPRAFASFCKPNASQGMDVRDAYTPYAIVRREARDVFVEIVGAPLNPPDPTFDPALERYVPEQRADGPFELSLPSQSELAARLDGYVRAQHATNRVTAFVALADAARALDAEESEERSRSANTVAALLRAITAARRAGER